MKKFVSLLFLALLLITGVKKADAANIVTKETLVKKIQSFFAINKTVTGEFFLKRDNLLERGIFYFKAPNKFKMVFGFNTGFKIEEKTIVSTGKQLWVYLPSIKVVINQDISRAQGNIAYSGSGIGIRRLIKKYDYDFYNNDSSLKNEPGVDEPVRILRLYRPKSFTGFNEILLYVREDGFILKSRGVTDKNKVIELVRKSIKLNVEVDNKHFVFRVPQDAQIIRNPLVGSR